MGQLKYLLLAALVAMGAYGLFHERLLAEPLWTPEGRTRFLVFSAIYWVAAGVLWRFGRRWLAPAAAAFVLGWTIWWCGLLAPLATLYLLGSCFFLGRIFWRESDAATAILLGLAGWMFAIWIALHFAVNTPLVYWIAFAIPYLAAPRRLAYARGSDTGVEGGLQPARGFSLAPPSGTKVPRGLKSALQKLLAVNPLLLYFLLAYWLATLKPEVSADALSMHLALPMAVARDHRWAFDFRQYSWALMPAGGDAFFTAAYLLGGEAAARLANFGLFVLICAAIYYASRRSLAAALFASTPLAFLVTGSLFVENVWAALILGGVLALIRYDQGGKPQDMRAAGALFGAALATKLTAAVFLLPASVLAVYAAWKRKQAWPLIAAAALLALFALPPYGYAWAKSGNPVFPFANAVFRSPDFDTTQSFSDPRFAAPLSWRTPYDVSFRTGTYLEGRGGGGGFQYFLLLAPAAIFVRRRSAQLCLAVAAAGAILIFAFLPYLRYLYPALPLFSIAFGGLLDSGDTSPGGLPRKPRHNGTLLLARVAGPVPLWPTAFAALAALNAWFLSAAGWYDRDFALFRKSQIASYLESAAPERALIDRLNREDSGEPAALFSSDTIAGLHARAYSAGWHTWAFWEEMGRARTSSEVAAILRRLGIRHIIAPASERGDQPAIESFLHEWAEPDGPRTGRMALFRLRDSPVTIPRALTSLPPGQYDDLDEHIEYNGPWIHDRQFVAASQGTLTYCDVSGAGLRLEFEGAEIDYIFTTAPNRGIAEVSIDGVARARIDMYSRQTRWRAHRLFEGLGAGPHLFEVRVRNEKNPASSGTFVDLDAVVVR
jgi:hypothetical protein